MAKTDEERGPIAAWARRERLDRGWTTHDVAGRIGITEPSYRGYEAGPRFSVPVRKALEKLYGTKAPDASTTLPGPGEMAGLVHALQEQTAALNRVVDLLERQAESDPSERYAGFVTALASQLVPLIDERLADRLGDATQ